MDLAGTARKTGWILIAMGVGATLWFGARTALIPACFGLPLLICGWLARKPSWRRHAMHVAALIAFLGTILPGFMVLRVLIQVAGGGSITRPVALAVQTGMALVCGVFLFLCVGSFVQARRRVADPS